MRQWGLNQNLLPYKQLLRLLSNPHGHEDKKKTMNEKFCKYKTFLL